MEESCRAGLVCFAIAAALTTACGPGHAWRVERLPQVPPIVRASAPSAGVPETAQAPLEDERVVLAFAGDVIAHDAVRNAAAHSEGSYRTLVEAARPALEGVDLAFANLESPVSTRTVRRGDMIFNAEEALLGALGGLGFQVISLANNHAFDQGRSGLTDTLEAAARFGLVVVGAGTTLSQACAPVYLERRGMRIAILARTLVMNFHDGGDHGAPDVCMLAEGPLKRAARAARVDGADLVIASLHWGNEYERTPRREQIDAAHRIVGAGVDLVIGHHPHVLQPVERVHTPRGSVAMVAYSLGNLLSNQGYAFDELSDPAQKGDTRDAAILRVSVSKDTKGVTIDEVTAVPLWTQHGDGGVITLGPATSRRERIARALRVRLTDPPLHDSQLEGKVAQ
jgi:hypothetical protein